MSELSQLLSRSVPGPGAPTSGTGNPRLGEARLRARARTGRDAEAWCPNHRSRHRADKKLDTKPQPQADAAPTTGVTESLLLCPSSHPQEEQQVLRPEPIAGQTGPEGRLLVTQVLRCGSDLLWDSGPSRSPGPGGGIPAARRFSSFLGMVLGNSAGHADSRPLSGPPGHRGRGLGAQVGGRRPRGRTNVCLPLRGPQHLPRASVCLSPVFDRLCPALSGCLSVWVSPVCLSGV